MPWECGRCVVWDFTCPDTLASSYRTVAATDPGAVAALAENRKDPNTAPWILLCIRLCLLR